MSLVDVSSYAGFTAVQQEKTYDICLKCYTDLLKTKRIEVWYDGQELSAIIHLLNQMGDLENRSAKLRLQGIPRELVSIKEIDRLRLFFENTHLIAEKGMDGLYNRVSVHGSLKGGGRTKIPFQPGLALGSIVRAKSIEQMEEYSDKMAKQQMFEEQIRNAEQQIEVLETKIKDRKREKDRQDGDPLIGHWKQQIESVQQCIIKISKQFEEFNQMDIPIFEGFHQAMESPIDMGSSHLEVQPRGFDSLSYSSQYIKMDEDISEIHNKISQSSDANNISAQANVGWGFWNANVSASHSWAQAASERVSQIQKKGNSRAVLLIHATVTTRHVRCFTDLQYDTSKLRDISEAMQGDNERLHKQYGISLGADNQKQIYLLTEAVMGGEFTALITFLKENTMNRKAEKKAQERSKESSVSLSGKHSVFEGKAEFSHKGSSASQNEGDAFMAMANTKINIEVFAQGVIPTFSRNIIENEVIKHTGLDSARELTLERQQENVHTLQSVMSAYENFAEQITKDSECGIPVGFHYQILTQKKIQEILNPK